MTALRLFTEEHLADSLRPVRTLRDAFNVHVAHEIEERSTRACYQAAIAAWEQHAGNPPLGEITDARMLAWQDAEIRAGLRPATINKHLRHVRRILRRCGPREAANPAGQGVLPLVPHVRALRTSRAAHAARLVTAEQWQRLYAQCDIAWWSEWGHPPDAWRLAIALLWNTGLRTSDLISVSRDDVVLETSCPIDGWQIESPHGWIWCRAGKTGKETIVPLHRFTRRLVETWIERHDPRPRLLSLGRPGEESPGDEKRRQSVRQALNEKAGIKPALTFQDLRKGASQAWSRVHWGAGALLLQHSARGVNDAYYSNSLPILLDAVTKLEAPFS